MGVYCDPMYPKIAYLFPLPNPLGFSFPDPAKPTNRFYDPNIEILGQKKNKIYFKGENHVNL